MKFSFGSKEQVKENRRVARLNSPATKLREMKKKDKVGNTSLFKVQMAMDFGKPEPDYSKLSKEGSVKAFQEWLDSGRSGLDAKLKELNKVDQWHEGYPPF